MNNKDDGASPKPPEFDSAIEQFDLVLEQATEAVANAEKRILELLREWSRTATQAEIARELGVSKMYVNDLLKGRRQWPRQIRPERRSGQK